MSNAEYDYNQETGMTQEDLDGLDLDGADETSADGDDEGDLQIDKRKVIIEKADRSLYQFYNWYKDEWLIIDPEWQRNYVWNPKRMSQLIESFLLDIPVPVIYLAKNKDSKYEVLDGLQRLSAVFKFFDNEYKLRGLEVLREYEGIRGNELQTTS